MTTSSCKHAFVPVNLLAAAVAWLGIAALGFAEEPTGKPVTLKTEHFLIDLEVGPCPGIAFGRAATLDTRRKRILLWGGVAAEDKPLRDLMAFDLSTAKLTTVAREGKSPDACFVPSMAVDAKREAVYVFGGWAKGAEGPSTELHSSPLGGKPGSWKRINVGKPWPPGRNGACLVADPEGDCFVLFGGDGGPNILVNFTPLDDLWRYDLSAGKWEAIKATGQAPSARWHAMAAVDPKARKLFLIGGAGLGKDQFDRQLRELDLKKSEWQVLKAKGDAPPSLQGATLTFDRESRALVLVGGLRHERPGPATSSEIWIFDMDRSAWEHLDGGEMAQRRDHTAAAYDPGSKTHYVLGGHVSNTVGNFYERGKPIASVLTLKVRRKE